MTPSYRHQVLGLAIASVAFVAIVAPSRSLAGTYIVEACGNGPNLMWQGSASPGWVAEENCNRDGTGNLAVGIPDPSAGVPAGSSASYQLVAPLGATVDWIEPNF